MGAIRIDIFPSMELGGAPAQLFDQARDGDADIVWTAPGLTPGRFPKIETFELPFLPSRRALVSSEALQDFAAIYLKDEFDEVHPLCFSCADRGVIHAYAPVRSIEDIKGLKLHVQTRLAGEAMRALGAHPVPMPSEELPAALTATGRRRLYRSLAHGAAVAAQRSSQGAHRILRPVADRAGPTSWR